MLSVIVVCFQVEICDGLICVQWSLTQCGVFEHDHAALIMSRFWPPRCCCVSRRAASARFFFAVLPFSYPSISGRAGRFGLALMQGKVGRG